MSTSGNDFRILSPTAILGYGFPEELFHRGIQRRPHLIACDAGSTDPGPYYLGSGKPFTNRAMVLATCNSCWSRACGWACRRLSVRPAVQCGGPTWPGAERLLRRSPWNMRSRSAWP